jgi:predicted permease
MRPLSSSSRYDGSQMLKGTGWASDLWMDLRYGVRQLARTPVLAFSIVGMLTFGLGFNSGLFTFINAEAFRAHVPSPETFLTADAVYSFNGDVKHEERRVSLSDLEVLRAASSRMAYLAASADSESVWLDDDKSSTPVAARLVSCNYFSVFGLERPLLGRVFQPTDCAGNADRAIVVLSERIWREHFNSAADVVGKKAYLSRRLFTIVGVVPAGFAGSQRSGGVLVPLTAQQLLTGVPSTREQPWLRISGRLISAHSRQEVQATLQLAMSGQDRLHAGRSTRIKVTNGSTVAQMEWRQRFGFAFIIGTSLFMLGGICVNVALLLLSRAGSRKREIGVRLSLGASRTRLLRMLLVESLLLAVTAGIFGAWVSTWLPLVLYERFTGVLPYYSLAPDWLSFVWLSAVTLFTAVMAGAVPGFESLKVDLATALKASPGLWGGPTARLRARNVLLGAQAAVSIVLLLMAAVVANSALLLSPIDERLNTDQVLLAQSPPARPGAPPTSLKDFGDRLRMVSGVKSVAFADHVRQAEIKFVKTSGEPNTPLHPVNARLVSPAYFATIQLPILRGRSFVAHDPPSVSIVSAALAARLWPGQNPIGKALIGPDGRASEVVGVSADSAAGFFNSVATQLYNPMPSDVNAAEILVSINGAPGPVARAITGFAREIDPRVVPPAFTLRAYYDRHSLGIASLQQVVVALGTIMLAVSMAGLYGVVNYSVSQRIHELGIRAAIGATQGNLFRSVLVSGAKPLLPGLLVGLGLFVMGTQLMAPVFFPATNAALLRPPGLEVYFAGAGVLTLSAIAALLGPARRAALCDPVKVLRQE